MYQNILLPLDGSELSETAIPHAEALALECRAGKITVLYVLEADRYEGMVRAGKRPGEYFQRILERLRAKGIAAEVKVLTGNPPDAIVSYAEANHCDVIVMASHGRSGISRWAIGSVADRVFRASSVPVLLVRVQIPRGHA